MTNKLSIQMARNIMLAAQGLDHPSDQPVTKADVLDVIRRMYLLHIDTINVAAPIQELFRQSGVISFHPPAGNVSR